VVTVFVFGAAAIFLIVRILYIWFLLIIAPIAWMLWIMPDTSKYFSQWWNKFIQWSFFAPIYVFMIYLSLSIFDATGKLNPKAFWAVSIPGWNTPAPGLTTVGMPSAIFQWILVIAMMFGSLIVAQKFGVEGANGARKMLTGWGTGAKNWAGRYARRKGASWTRPMSDDEKAAPLPKFGHGKLGALWRRGGAAIGGAAVAIPGARGVYLKQLGAEQKAYEADFNKYKGLNRPTLEAISAGLIVNPREKLALKQARIEKDIDKPKADEAMALLQQAGRYGQEDKFIDLISSKEFFTEDYGYDKTQRERLLDRAKVYGKEDKLLGVISDKFGFGRGKIQPDATELTKLLDRAEAYPVQMRKMLDSVHNNLGALSLKNYSDAELTKLAERAKEHGQEYFFLKIFPQFYKEAGKTLEEAIKFIRPADAAKVSGKALDDKDILGAIVKNYTGEHMMNLAREGRGDFIDGMEAYIKKLGNSEKERIEVLEGLNFRLGKWAKSPAGKSFFNLK